MEGPNFGNRNMIISVYQTLKKIKIVDPKGQISNSFHSDLKRLIRFINKFRPQFNVQKHIDYVLKNKRLIAFNYSY